MADGHIRIDTTLETKKAAKSFKDLENMARRTGENLRNAMKSGDTKNLEKRLKEQQDIIKQTQKEIDKYQTKLNSIDSSKAVISLQSKIAAENEVVENAKRELDQYSQKLEKVAAKILEMKEKASAKVREQNDPEMLALNPKLEGYETNKMLADDIDYQSAIKQESELHAKMSEYAKKIKDAGASASELKNKLHEVQTEQKSILGEKISTLSASLSKAKDNASRLTECLSRAKKKADMSKPAKKTSSAFKNASDSAKTLGNHISHVAGKGIKKIMKLSIAVFGIRSAFVFAKRAASEYLQSNEQLSGQIQGIWNAVAQAIGPVVQTIVGWITTLVSYINALVKSFTGVDFVAKGNAAALDKQAKAAGNVAKETKKANTQLIAFDELNVMSNNDTSDAGGGNGALVPQLEVDPVNIDSIKEKFMELLEPIRNAWDNYGAGFVKSFKRGMNEIWKLTKSIGNSFKEVWMNGTGEETCSLILQILTDIFDIVGNLASRFREAWDTAGIGTRIIQNIWNVVNVLLGGIRDITQSCKEWISTLDFLPILSAIDTLTSKLSPLAEIISGNLKWAIDNVLLPLGKWAIEDAAPPLIDSLAAAFQILSTALEGTKNAAMWVWDNFLQPIASWSGGAIITILEDIALAFEWLSEQEELCRFIGELSVAVMIFNAVLSANPITWIIAGIVALIAIIVECIKHWDDISAAVGACWDWICEKWDGAVQFFVDIWDGICATFNGIKEWFQEKFEAAYETICGIFSGIGQWFSDRYEDIKGVFASVGAWFTDKFTLAWDGIKKAFAGVKNFFSGVWQGICNVFGNVTGWFKDKFSAAWQAVKNVFSTGGKVFDGIKDGILNGLKAVINALISGINRVIKIPFDGINWALQKIKDISILGMHPFDWIGTISVPQIPKLAKGGIVNNPTLSIIGEAGKEAVIPLENNTEWIDMVASRLNLQGNQDQGVIEALLKQLIEAVESKELHIGDREIGEANQRYNGRKGFSFGSL